MKSRFFSEEKVNTAPPPLKTAVSRGLLGPRLTEKRQNGFYLPVKGSVTVTVMTLVSRWTPLSTVTRTWKAPTATLGKSSTALLVPNCCQTPADAEKYSHL